MTKNEIKILLTAVDNATATLNNVERDIHSLDSTSGSAASGGMGAFDARLGAIATTAAAIGASAIFSKIASGISEVATEAAIAATDHSLFEKQLANSNQSIAEGVKLVSQLSERLKIHSSELEGNTTQLLRQGLSMSEISQLYEAAAASALAFGTDASSGIESVTEAIVTQSSVYLNHAGISENLDSGYKEYAKTLGKTVAGLSNEEKAHAAVQLVLKATREEVAGLDTIMSGLIGVQSETTLETTKLRQELGENFLPVVLAVQNALLSVLKVINQTPAGIKVMVVSFGAIVSGAVAVTAAIAASAAGLAALGITAGAAATALAPFLIGGAVIAGIAGLAVHFANAETATERADRQLRQLTDDAEPARKALFLLTQQTSEEGLQGAVSRLAATLNEQGQKALNDWAQTALVNIGTQAELQKAILATVKKYAELEEASHSGEMLKLAKERNQVLEQMNVYQARLRELNQDAESGSSNGLANPKHIAKLESELADLSKQYDILSESMTNLNPAAEANKQIIADMEAGIISVDDGVAALAERLGLALPKSFVEANNGTQTIVAGFKSAQTTVKTLSSVLAEYQAGLEEINKKEALLGDNYDDLQEQLRLTKTTFEDLLAVGADDATLKEFAADIGLITSKLEDLAKSEQRKKDAFKGLAAWLKINKDAQEQLTKDALVGLANWLKANRDAQEQAKKDALAGITAMLQMRRDAADAKLQYEYDTNQRSKQQHIKDLQQSQADEIKSFGYRTANWYKFQREIDALNKEITDTALAEADRLATWEKQQLEARAANYKKFTDNIRVMVAEQAKAAKELLNAIKAAAEAKYQYDVDSGKLSKQDQVAHLQQEQTKEIGPLGFKLARWYELQREIERINAEIVEDTQTALDEAMFGFLGNGNDTDNTYAFDVTTNVSSKVADKNAEMVLGWLAKSNFSAGNFSASDLTEAFHATVITTTAARDAQDAAIYAALSGTGPGAYSDNPFELHATVKVSYEIDEAQTKAVLDVLDRSNKARTGTSQDVYGSGQTISPEERQAEKDRTKELFDIRAAYAKGAYNDMLAMAEGYDIESYRKRAALAKGYYDDLVAMAEAAAIEIERNDPTLNVLKYLESAPDPTSTTQDFYGSGQTISPEERANSEAEAAADAAAKIVAANKSIVDSIQMVINISRALGSMGGEVGKFGKAVEETAQVAMDAVMAIASGDPVAMVGAALEAVAFVVSGINEMMRDEVAETVEALDQSYELLGKNLIDQMKVVEQETRYFLIFPYQKDVVNEQATRIGLDIANAVATASVNGLLNGLDNFDTDFAAFMDRMVAVALVQSEAAQEQLLKITELIQEAAADGVITATERANIEAAKNAYRVLLQKLGEDSGLIRSDAEKLGELLGTTISDAMLQGILRGGDAMIEQTNQMVAKIVAEAAVKTEAMQKHIAAIRQAVTDALANDGKIDDTEAQAIRDAQQAALEAINATRSELQRQGFLAPDKKPPPPKDPSGGKGQEFNASRLPPAVQYAVALPLVAAGEHIMAAAVMMEKVFSNDSYSGIRLVGADEFGGHVDRFGGHVNRLGSYVEKLTDEGIRIITSPGQSSSGQSQSLTRHLR